MDYTIVTDSREQNKLWTTNTEVKKLDAGDYSIVGYENEFVIERKSISDLVGTLTTGHKRFNAEIERSKKLKYFAIIIEGTINDVMKGIRYSKTPGYVVSSILFTIHMKYNIPVFFCRDRTECKTVIRELAKTFIKQQLQ